VTGSNPADQPDREGHRAARPPVRATGSLGAMTLAVRLRPRPVTPATRPAPVPQAPPTDDAGRLPPPRMVPPRIAPARITPARITPARHVPAPVTPPPLPPHFRPHPAYQVPTVPAPAHPTPATVQPTTRPDAGKPVTVEVVKRGPGLAVLIAVLMLTGTTALVTWHQDRERPRTATAAAPAPPVAAADPAARIAGPAAAAVTGPVGAPRTDSVSAPRATSVSAPLGTRRELRFNLLSDATRTTVRSTDLAGALYVITTTDAGAVPAVRNGTRSVDLSLTRTGGPGAVSVEIQLNSRVAWTLGITGAASEHVVDMRSGGLAGLDLIGGAARIALFLPTPDAAMTVAVTGGASELAVHAPAGVPVRVRTSERARTVRMNGAAVRATSTITTPGWSAAATRYDVDATARIDSLIIDRAS
jgi:hypothetical protein